jgi:hypothetical protein
MSGENVPLDTHTLLPMARRRDGFVSPVVHVERYLTGIIIVEVHEVAVHAWVQFTVQVSPDQNRWADHSTGPRWDQPGRYELRVSNIGMYLRISYELSGSVTFGACFRGLFWGEHP